MITANASARITSVDAVRGFAVCGILIMNIVAFAMPGGAYDNPTVYGGASGADLVAWGAAFALADGKMRGLFTLLFGVSLAIVADSAAARGANPAIAHYRRMGWLLVIGMLHGLLIWYGDILVEYALTGAILFIAWRWRPVTLFYVAGVFFLGDLIVHSDAWRSAVALRDAVASPAASAADQRAWQAMLVPDRGEVARQLAGYRGGLVAVFLQRLEDLSVLLEGLPGYLIESLGTAAFGIALYRVGYFTQWPARWHRLLIMAGLGLALPLMVVTAATVAAQDFDPVARAAASAIATLLRPAIMQGYASAIILAVSGGRSLWLIDRLAAAGRMALSNYLATSLVMTTIFYGHGLGWFGQLSRAELWPLVLMMWTAMLGWSKPWLQRFRYGPAEWLWRSLAKWRWQPIHP